MFFYKNICDANPEYVAVESALKKEMYKWWRI